MDLLLSRDDTNPFLIFIDRCLYILYFIWRGFKRECGFALAFERADLLTNLAMKHEETKYYFAKFIFGIQK